jgi:hypothetical protein
MTGFYARETTRSRRPVGPVDYLDLHVREQPSVIKELRLFLEVNKGSEITGKFQSRLEDVQKQGSSMRYHCIGGQ